MPTTPINSSTISIIPSLILLLIVVATCMPSSSSIEAAGKYPRSIPSHRALLAAGQRTRGGQIPSCSEMVSRSQCSQNPKCRWCKSEALDDMCFGKIEAWKLPQQVFVCD